MHQVEGVFSFPDDRAHFHARRTEWLFQATGLAARLQSVPVAVLTGSCGKGSTAAFLAHILEEMVGRLALGTKPPLLETPEGNRERYQTLEGQGPRWIEPQHFAALVAELEPWLDRLPPELGPWAPYDLRYFVLGRLFCDFPLAVLEANIGLKHDPASVFPRRAVTVLTPIGTDHSGLLLPPKPLPPALQGLRLGAGPLWHKAGGVRAGEPVVLGRQTPELERAALQLLSQQGAGKLYRYGREGRVSQVSSGLLGTRAVLELGGMELAVELQTVGEYQADNAVVAALAALALVESGQVEGDLGQAITRGVARTRTPGRLEIVSRDPLCYYTVASSQTKLEALLDSLDQMLQADRPRARVVVCATFLDRIFQVRQVVERLATWPRLGALVTTAHAWTDDSRDVDPEQVADWARAARPGLKVEAVPEPAQAARRALELGQPALLLGNGMAYALEALGGPSRPTRG